MSAIIDQLRQLHEDLHALVAGDSEQEVTGAAFVTFERLLSEARARLPPDSTVGQQVPELYTVEAVEAGEPPRAAEALVLVGQLKAALESYQRQTDESAPTTILIDDEDLSPGSPFRFGR